MPSAGETVNKIEKVLVLMKLLFKWRDNKYIGKVSEVVK